MAKEGTVRIKNPHKRGYATINESDYDPKKHTLIKGGEDQENAAVADSGKNPSGTYSEPTPTDIRYPDKTETEFENNMGAFIDKSAAGLREERGLPDAPGGIHPVEGMEVKHKGRGAYSIMVGDDEVVSGMSKQEADDFGAKSNEDKAAFVRERKA